LFPEYPTGFFDSPKGTPGSLLEIRRFHLLQRTQVDVHYIKKELTD
jgi:hypothetical protein